jgi:two-component system CheB/CheR fusion protein
VDLDYRIRTVNEAFCGLANTPAPDLERRSLPDLAASLWGPDPSLRSHLADLRAAKDTRKTFEFVQETSAEDSKVLQIRGSVLHPDGELFLLVTVEDITAHKEIERLLQEKGDRLSVEVASATRELGQSREELRALTSGLFVSQEEERRRVARELHDDVSQRLALIELDGQQMDLQIDDNPELARQKLRELRAKIGELSKEVRGISHRLHPAIIEDLGLASALRSLTEEFRGRERMITTFSQQDLPDQIPPGVAIGLYRIAQEALRNVAKHAGQTHVKVSLRGGSDELVLQVTDSGIGFDMEEAKHGLGLISMKERARHLNAAFQVDSTLGDGTRVTVEVPLGVTPPAEY